MLIAASLPPIAAAALLTIPSLLFPTPGHNAYFHFARQLQHEPLIYVPIVLGAVCSTLSIKRSLG